MMAKQQNNNSKARLVRKKQQPQTPSRSDINSDKYTAQHNDQLVFLRFCTPGGDCLVESAVNKSPALQEKGCYLRLVRGRKKHYTQTHTHTTTHSRPTRAITHWLTF